MYVRNMYRTLPVHTGAIINIPSHTNLSLAHFFFVPFLCENEGCAVACT